MLFLFPSFPASLFLLTLFFWQRVCILPTSTRSLPNGSTQHKFKSQRCGTTANVALLKDHLSGGTVRSSSLLVLCKLIQLKVSLIKSCGTTPNFSLLGDALFWGTARASYLLLHFKLNQSNVSFKVSQISKKRM